MRILFVASYITSNAHPALLRNQTGFGYMVHDIAQYVGKKELVDFFLVGAMTPVMDIDDFHILGNSWGNWIKGFRFRYMGAAYRFLKKYALPFEDKLRVLFYYESMGEIEERLKSYDVIHIHGCGSITNAVIRLCKKHCKPFVVTLHGLNSFEEAISLLPSMKQQEKDFLVEAAQNNYPVTFISTGLKNTAEVFVNSVIGPGKTTLFTVILNGCVVDVHNQTIDVRSKYGIPSDAFVFLCVGNISRNKNQFQVAKAYSLLPEEIKNGVHMLFCGRYNERDDVYQYINDNNMQDHLHLCGMIPKNEVHNYYQAGNATVLVSKSEGFGLSIIEGYVYGLPGLVFRDMAAVEDLYDDGSLIVVDKRTDEDLSKGMQEIISTRWDADHIKKLSKQFSLEQMAEYYLEEYKVIMDSKSPSRGVKK